MKRGSFSIFILALFALFFQSTARLGGSTAIHVETESGGNIDTNNDGIYENVHGAMFWNETGWGVNETYGHMYFTDKATGEKLKEFTTSTVDYSGGGNNVEVLSATGPYGTNGMRYRGTHNTFSYRKDYNGSTYQFDAAEFVIELVSEITGKPAGQKVILRSRSADATRVTPYFDVYIDNQNGTCEAMRGDPVWFHYPTDCTQALAQTDATANKRGDLVTPGSQYWMDIDGGSELGGMTYKLITGSMAGTQLGGLGTPFISAFALQYTDPNSELRELLFHPHVYAITKISADSSFVKEIFVLDTANNSIHIWPVDASGNLAPTRSIQGQNTTLNQGGSIAVDANWIYVGNTANQSVDIWPIHAAGNLAPTRSIKGQSTMLNQPRGVAVDARWIYVANSANQSVDVWPIQATGNLAPSRSIKGANTNLDWPVAVSVDANWIYAASLNNDTVNIWPINGTGDLSPTRSIQRDASKFMTSAVAVDQNWIYTTNMQAEASVDIWPLNADGAEIPTRSIKGTNTGLSGVTSIAVNSNWIYVGNGSLGKVDIWPIEASGNLAPTRTIGGQNTTLNGPELHVALSPPPSCLSFGENLSISIPCFDVSGTRFSFRFDYAHDLVWEANIDTIGVPGGGWCWSFDEGLDISVPCLYVNGTPYEFVFRYANGLSWAVDVDSIKVAE
jgi:6-phosphogluconolactonase (cycloisomerase 2 family)